jgi:anti-anti-sigma factor
MDVLESALSGVPLLKLIGDGDGLSAAALEDVVRRALAADGARLLIDLSECPSLGGASLSVLGFAFCHVRRKRGWLGVIAPNAVLLRRLEMVGLRASRDFRVFSDLGEAMEASREPAPAPAESQSDETRVPFFD